MSGSLPRWLRDLPVVLAAVLAMGAQYKMEGQSTGLPLFAVAILLTMFIRARLPDNAALIWLLRLLVIALVIGLNLSRRVENVNMFDTGTMTWFGEICAAELALCSWISRPDNRPPIRLLWLSGLVMLAASSTANDTFMIWLTPAYMGVLLLALRWCSSIPPSKSPRAAIPWGYGVAFACALLCGAGFSALLTSQRTALTTWGMKLLSEHVPYESGSLAMNSTLTSTFGQKGALTRALRIEGEGEFSHLRGAVFDNYDRGTWGPRLQERRNEVIVPGDVEPTEPGRAVHVTRILNNHGIVFTPLNVIGIRFPDGSGISEQKNRGASLMMATLAPSEYDLILSDIPEHQGPLCLPLTAEQRQRLLRVPHFIAPGVHTLAAEIIGPIHEPRLRMEAIERYLLTHHHYSLLIKIGSGDPVSEFLLERKSAHCEYFASAAVILARLAGIPARYVIGYYAHERGGDGATIVRQRDAHAWAECWIEGTGWVVLDATPGDGLPSQFTEQPPLLTRFMENLEDWIAAVRSGRIAGLRWKLAAGLGVLLFAGILGRLLWMLWRSRHRQRSLFTYTAAAAELAALLREFERACHRARLDCPAGQTWNEYLANLDAERMEAIGNNTIAHAREFVRAYNAARFGPGASDEMLVHLRLLLEKMSGKAARLPLSQKGVSIS